MTKDSPRPPVARRSFLAGLGATAALVGVGAPGAAARPLQGGGWQPARHEQDDWLEQMPGQHRFFLDTLTATGAGEGIGFAHNYLVANESGYGLSSGQLAVVLCLRHFATAFAFTDAIWAKYGAIMAKEISFVDPKTSKAPTANLYRSADYGMSLPNWGTTLDDLIGQGVHFAVCDMATHYFAGVVAKQKGITAEEAYTELKAGAIPNCHFVAAGIVAVNRAQERGYSTAYVG